MTIEKRLGAYYFINESGELAAQYFFEYYDKNLKMVIACDLPTKCEVTK